MANQLVIFQSVMRAPVEACKVSTNVKSDGEIVRRKSTFNRAKSHLPPSVTQTNYTLTRSPNMRFFLHSITLTVSKMIRQTIDRNDHARPTVASLLHIKGTETRPWYQNHNLPYSLCICDSCNAQTKLTSMSP